MMIMMKIICLFWMIIYFKYNIWHTVYDSFESNVSSLVTFYSMSEVINFVKIEAESAEIC